MDLKRAKLWLVGISVSPPHPPSRRLETGKTGLCADRRPTSIGEGIGPGAMTDWKEIVKIALDFVDQQVASASALALASATQPVVEQSTQAG